MSRNNFAYLSLFFSLEGKDWTELSYLASSIEAGEKGRLLNTLTRVNDLIFY